MAVCIDCFKQIPDDTPAVSPLGARCQSCTELATAGSAGRPAAPAPTGGPPGWAAAPGVTGPVTNTAPGRSSNELGRALVIGLAAAVLGGGIWYAVAAATDYHVGLVAVVVGTLVGIGVSYDQPGRDRVPLQAMAVVLTLLALFAAEYFIVRHAVIDALTARGIDPNIALFQSPSDTIDWVQNDISDDPSVLIFAAVAVFQAWRIPTMRRR